MKKNSAKLLYGLGFATLLATTTAFATSRSADQVTEKATASVGKATAPGGEAIARADEATTSAGATIKSDARPNTAVIASRISTSF